jgi:hypothetical protein
MGICRIYRMPGGTLDQYDAVTAAAGDALAAGAQVHLAGTDGDALYVIEVWPSREALGAWIESQPAGNEAQVALLPHPEVVEFDLHRQLQV